VPSLNEWRRDEFVDCLARNEPPISTGFAVRLTSTAGEIGMRLEGKDLSTLGLERVEPLPQFFEALRFFEAARRLLLK
jgi:hypothetical protein